MANKAWLVLGLIAMVSATAPEAPTGYELQDGIDCDASDGEQILREKGDHTVADCVASCEAHKGCCGFSWDYTDLNKGRCVSKGCDCNELSGRTSMAVYWRDAEASAGTGKLPAIPSSEAAYKAPAGYTPYDKNDCDSSDGEKVLMEKGDHTVATCKAVCEAHKGCCGFGLDYGAALKGRCVSKGCQCQLQTGRSTMIFYKRDAGVSAGGRFPAIPSSDAALAAPSGYTPADKFDCDSTKGEVILTEKGDSTVEDCKGKCEDEDTCCGFSYDFGDVNKGRCVSKGCGCELLSGRSTTIFYIRDSIYFGAAQSVNPQLSILATLGTILLGVLYC